MANGGDRPEEPEGDAYAADAAEDGRTPDPAVEEDPPGDPEQPVETVVRYESASERRERLHEERRQRRHRRITEAGVALAALFVSLAVFLVNGAVYLRGSRIVVLDPEEVLFYRSTGPAGSSLKIAVPARMINAAAGDYGDVVVDASVAIGPKQGERGRFRHTELVEASMSQQPERMVENCPQGARCVANTGHYVIERARKLLDVPGGTSRSEYLGFRIERLECVGDPAFCRTFNGFDDAVSHLRAQRQPVIRLLLRYQFDGRRTVRCTLTPDAAMRTAIFDYLTEKGWASAVCENARET